jgi:hypothetical protein
VVFFGIPLAHVVILTKKSCMGYPRVWSPPIFYYVLCNMDMAQGMRKVESQTHIRVWVCERTQMSPRGGGGE